MSFTELTVTEVCTDWVFARGAMLARLQVTVLVTGSWTPPVEALVNTVSFGR